MRTTLDPTGTATSRRAAGLSLIKNGTTSTTTSVHSNAAHGKFAGFVLSRAEKEYVRSVMFPEDTTLVRHVCGDEAFS